MNSPTKQVTKTPDAGKPINKLQAAGTIIAGGALFGLATRFVFKSPLWVVISAGLVGLGVGFIADAQIQKGSDNKDKKTPDKPAAKKPASKPSISAPAKSTPTSKASTAAKAPPAVQPTPDHEPLPQIVWNEIRTQATWLAQRKGKENPISAYNVPGMEKEKAILLDRFYKLITQPEADAVIEFLKTYGNSEEATFALMGPEKKALVLSFFNKMQIHG